MRDRCWLSRWLGLAFLAAACGLLGACGSDVAQTEAGASAFAPVTLRKIVPLDIGGTALLEADNKVYYAGPNVSVFSSNERVLAYDGSQAVAAIEAVRGGVLLVTADGVARRSRDGRNLGGGGNTTTVHRGDPAILGVHAVHGGVLVQFVDRKAFWSPDGLNLRGGGQTVLAYEGSATIAQAIGFDPGILARFDDGRAFFSPDGRSLGGGGATVLAHGATAVIDELRRVDGGVMTWFQDGRVWFSFEGRELDGGRAIPALPGTWEKVADSSPFGPRDSGAGAVFSAQWWLAGGFFRSGPDTSYFDIWRSGDLGRTWTLTFGNPTPQTGSRADHPDPYSPLVVFRDELFAVGSTVWSTRDGSTWTQRSTRGPIVAREDARAIVAGGRIVYIDPQYGGVYFSSDGVTWSAGIDITGFRRRCGALIAALPSGRIVITGGAACDYSSMIHDTWISDDAGLTWRQVLDEATGEPRLPPFSRRMWPCRVVDERGVLWLMGGFRVEGSVKRNFTDVWYSRDGIDWHPIATRDSALTPRHASTCYLTDEAGFTGRSMYVVAGKGGDIDLSEYTRVLNDVHVLRLPAESQLSGVRP